MKDRIMRAFIEEIQDNGMKFTMDDLSRRLGISKRTLYEHFSSKAEILDAIIEQTFLEMDEKTEQIIKDDRLSLVEKIKGVMTVLPTHFEFYDLRVFDQMKRFFPEQWAKLDAALKDDWLTLRRLIEQGIEQGEVVPMNVSLLMKMIVNALDATLDQRFFLQNNITVSEALNSIVDVLLYGFIPAEKRGG